MPMLKRAATLIWCAAVLASGPIPGARADGADGPHVEAFSPQGTVKAVRQVAARFSAPMVAFGDPRLPQAFDVDCPEPGKARWVDGRNWVYDFDHDPAAGVVCRFTLKSGLRTLDGRPLAGERQFSFSTGGPAVLQSLPYEGADDIDEQQVFILGLDAPATRDSILAHVHCGIGGINERVGVRLLEGAERKAVLAQRRDFLQRYFRVLFKGPDHRLAIFTVAAPKQGTPYERFLALEDAEDSPIVVLACRRGLPVNTDFRLVWGKGVSSSSGVPTEQDQVLAFHVRDAFRARFGCERVNRQADCIPVLPMSVDFTAPVARDAAAKIRLRDADGREYPAKPAGDDRARFVEGVSFEGPFPPRGELTLSLPDHLTDDAGRVLVNQNSFPLQVRTDDDPPLAKFPSTFGIIELHAGAMLPVTVRNLERRLPLPVLPAPGSDAKSAVSAVAPGGAATPPSRAEESTLDRWYRRLAELRERYWPEPAEIDGRWLKVKDPADVPGWLRRVQEAQEDAGQYDPDRDKFVYEHRAGERSVFTTGLALHEFRLPKPNGARSFDVIGIPFAQPGFYVVELASPRLGAALYGKPQPYHVQTAALVTNLSVHFLKGRESSLVWVTTLDRAQPAAGADVIVRDCAGAVYFRGRTDRDGIARIDTALPRDDRLPECLKWTHAYIVTASLGGDMSFVMSNWNEGITPWRFNLPTAAPQDPDVITTVFDRTLLRAGETVHMKHFARLHVRAGFDVPAPERLASKIVIRHQSGDQTYELPIRWDVRGIAESQWAVPKDAKQGTYVVTVEAVTDPALGTKQSFNAGSFRVEAYRVPTMKAVLQPLQPDLVNVATAALDVQISYLNGGGAALAPVKLRGLVQPKTVSFPGYDDFVFANGNVREGVEGDSGPETWGDDDYQWDEEGAPRDKDSRPLATQAFTLDQAGAARVQVTGLPRVDVPKDILSEIEYRDANGELLTAAAHMTLWPAQRIVGIKPDAWALSKDHFKFQALALDLKGRPVAGARIRVDLFRRQTYSHRKRLLGGFYAYEHHNEITRIGDACAGPADAQGRLYCDIRSPVDGNLILRAQVADGAGNVSYANRDVWVAGSGEWWFEAGNEDRMEVIPEKKSYQPGDQAVFQVRMPFRSATALVAVEREGVMDARVMPLTGRSPVVQVPVRGRYAPNVYVSVLAVRGRADDVQPTAMVDLGRPAYRLGIGEINVGWRAHELKVEVRADKAVYKVREHAHVKVRVRTASGAPLPAGAEVALAAVDEGLLELMPNRSWDLLGAMMGRRPIEVETSTAQMQVVGKRHYGRKALPPGGGGGRGAARELFDTLLLWNGRVRLDAGGEAEIDVPLNDSLTAFRIVAVADAGNGLFGTGSVSIRSTQDLMLVSGLPPLVREQDEFHAGFIVRNAADHAIDATVEARVEQRDSAGTPGPTAGSLPPIPLRLAAGEAKEIGWDLTAPAGADRLQWDVTATADGATADRIRLAQQIVPAVPVRTFQATLAQLNGGLDLPVAAPADAIPGRGGIDVQVQAKLSDGLAGVREYMRSYVYDCLEQRVSRAIALHDGALWESVMDELPAYLDGDGFVKYFPQIYQGSDVLTAYVLSIAAEAGRTIPETPLGRMQAALTGFIEARVGRDSPLPTADLGVRRLAAMAALARYRAIDPAWLGTISIEPNLWPTSALLDWIDLLNRTGSIPDRAARLAEAKQILRSRLNLQGTALGFSTERSDALWWLMVSADANAGRAILSLLDDPQWREDMGRLARGALGRQVHGHWSTTIANAWGTVAMDRFSKAFETTPVTGVTRASLGGATQELAWSADTSRGEWKLPWPAASASLAVRQEGTGAPWVTVSSRAAIPLKGALSSGYRIVRTVTPVDQKTAGAYSRGDVLRVRLEIESQSDMSWVVVDDPVPAGATILGSGLGTDSQILTQDEQKRGYVWPAFEERKPDAFHAYYEFVPKGTWMVEYTMRLNNAGRFLLPPTRVEAMYAPEMFGELPNDPVSIQP